MRTEDEIREKLRELHGEPVRKEMGGLYAQAKAEALVWALGHNPVNITEGNSHARRKVVDVSEYVDDIDT